MRILKAILSAINSLNEEVRKLEGFQDKSVIEKARKYDELVAQLARIRLRVDKTAKLYDDDGNEIVRVYYERPYGDIKITTEGDAEYDAIIEAINEVGLIGYRDMETIKDAVSKASSENK